MSQHTREIAISSLSHMFSYLHWGFDKYRSNDPVEKLIKKDPLGAIVHFVIVWQWDAQASFPPFISSLFIQSQNRDDEDQSQDVDNEDPSPCVDAEAPKHRNFLFRRSNE